MATAAHTLRTAQATRIPGGPFVVYISRDDAKDLRRQVLNRASRVALQIALDSQADPVYLMTVDRDRIICELTTSTPEALRKVGAL